MSNTELASRAGLGKEFFSSVARDHRRPKLANFLTALTVIIDVADERLFDVDNSDVSARDHLPRDPKTSAPGIERDYAELLSLAVSLGGMARAEVNRLESEHPNDPVTIENKKRQRDLLLVFANGFDRIAAVLSALASDPTETVLLGKARDAVADVAREINAWWRNNATEAIDWGVRLPVLVAGVAALGWAGANMTVATSAVAAIVGGGKVVDAIRGKRKSG